jgi:hypothetical protein
MALVDSRFSKTQEHDLSSTRFDYVKYDETANDAQAKCKDACLALESAINAIGQGGGREKAIALTQLEHVYARCGRAIRDDQISRNGSAELQEGRGNE